MGDEFGIAQTKGFHHFQPLSNHPLVGLQLQTVTVS